jgi:hypothetical protein
MTDRIDFCLRGELSPQEARKLAQASLDSPELFDELTDAALAKAALNPRTVRAGKVFQTRRKVAVLTAVLAAAAVLIVVVLPHSLTRHASNIQPVLDLGADTARPVLLASGLHPANAPVFRGVDTDSRAPQNVGTIVSFEDGSANLNLGSLDGLAKGSELQVFRGSAAMGSLRVTAVFRDRARASVTNGIQVRPSDEVRVGAADHLNALLQQVSAVFNRGNPDTAIKLAREAVQWGETAAIPTDVMAVSWNQLAVLQLLQGHPDGAETLLLRAASAISKTNPLYSQIQNNVGVLAEMRGERDKAAISYQNARDAAADDERPAVERNLARVGSRR